MRYLIGSLVLLCACACVTGDPDTEARVALALSRAQQAPVPPQAMLPAKEDVPKVRGLCPCVLGEKCVCPAGQCACGVAVAKAPARMCACSKGNDCTCAKGKCKCKNCTCKGTGCKKKKAAPKKVTVIRRMMPYQPAYAPVVRYAAPASMRAAPVQSFSGRCVGGG